MTMLAAPRAEAQSPDQAGHRSNGLTVYLWGASIQGNLGYVFDDRPFEISLQDLMRNLEMTGMLLYRRDLGEWFVAVDLVYLKQRAGEGGSVALPIGNGQTVDAEAALKMTSWLGGLYGGRVINRSQVSSFQIVVGARYFSLTTDLDVEVVFPPEPPLIDSSLSASARLWDGVVGINGHFVLAPRWRLQYSLDVGAGESDFTSQGLVGVVYGFRWGDVSLNYRYLYYDEGEDGLITNMALRGPAAAVKFRF